jgi:hypothetical protein
MTRLRTAYSEEAEDSFRSLKCAFGLGIDAGLGEGLYT